MRRRSAVRLPLANEPPDRDDGPVIAVLAPGQGAQSPGMLDAWLPLDGVRDRLASYSEAADMDLERLGTVADADEIKDTAVTQPLLVAAGLLAAGQLGLLDGPPAVERCVAGHSVGELTAAAVAGALRPVDAVAFAARRGAEMAAACAAAATGMSAVLGGEPDDVVKAIEAAGLTAANRNGAGQIVAAGDTEALEAFAAAPPDGVKLRPLAVAGAFHTDYMAPAAERLAGYADGLDVAAPRPTLLSNADGAAVDDGAELVRRLVAQVTLPVRWDLCMPTCAALGVTGVVELAPGGVLAGIARRELRGAERVAIKTPDDLDAARSLLSDGGTP